MSNKHNNIHTQHAKEAKVNVVKSIERFHESVNTLQAGSMAGLHLKPTTSHLNFHLGNVLGTPMHEISSSLPIAALEVTARIMIVNDAKQQQHPSQQQKQQQHQQSSQQHQHRKVSKKAKKVAKRMGYPYWRPGCSPAVFCGTACVPCKVRITSQ